MLTRTFERRIVSALAGSIGLLTLVAPSQAILIRPVEADMWAGNSIRMLTDAGQPGVAGTGGIYLCDPNDPNSVCWALYAPTSGPGALKDPSAAEALNNGEILIADSGNHRVLIVNQAGQTTWNSANVTFSDGRLIRGPVDVQLIPDGTPSLTDNPILIACKDNNRVVAIRRTGQVVWAMNSGLSRPLKAERLANGNTLIVESGRVIEVNAARQIVQSLAGIGMGGIDIADAERLPDGSTLVLDAGNGQLLRYTPGQPDPVSLNDAGDEWSLVGATDVDAIEQEGGYQLLITTPEGFRYTVID